MSHEAVLTTRSALEALRRSRRDDEVVVTAMGMAREWMALGELHPLDFVYVPSSMGQASSLGLGIALARPGNKVIVCNGDGSTLMNLGSLVTITAEAPRNLVLLLFDNGVYEVTGAQPTPGQSGGRRDGRHLDYAALGRACGFDPVFAFTDLATWWRELRGVIDCNGPTLAVLTVPPVPGGVGPRSPGPGRPRAAKFIDALEAAGRSVG